VNRAGDVMDETLEDSGPSQYFARAAIRAARDWRFVRGDSLNPRQWLLRFEFSRDGTTASASEDRAADAVYDK
jgi:hypothetical protein